MKTSSVVFKLFVGIALIASAGCKSKTTEAEMSMTASAQTCDSLCGCVPESAELRKEADYIPVLKVDSVNYNDIRIVKVEGYYYSDHDRCKFVASPYGLISVMFEATMFYKGLVTPSGDHYTDSINTHVLMAAATISDGAVSEALATYCMRDFQNKTDIVLDMYRSGHTDLVENYWDMLSWDLAASADGAVDAYIKELSTRPIKQVNRSVLDTAISHIRTKAAAIE
ncbi:MAG: hypothetical protein K2M55_00500 [Muribaculaceae bacterium]|nr:hypothetical protein [Muribaculaceae bacterium]